MSALDKSLRRRLNAPRTTPRLRGDHELNPEFESLHQTLRDAAVLVLIIDTPPSPRVVFTRRTAHLKAHGGQISFPGGRLDPGDATPEACALRETEEEIGIRPTAVTLIGRLDTYITRTGFRVVPVVGSLRDDPVYTPDPFEVETVFEVPLSHFVAPDSLREDRRTLLGRTRSFFAFSYGDYYIWGATAGILKNLREVLGVSC